MRDEKLELSNFFCGYHNCLELIIENLKLVIVSLPKLLLSFKTYPQS